MPKKQKNTLTCAYGGFSLLSTVTINDEQVYTISSNIATFPEEIARIITNLEIKKAIFSGVPDLLKDKINEKLNLFNYDKHCEVTYL